MANKYPFNAKTWQRKAERNRVAAAAATDKAKGSDVGVWESVWEIFKQLQNVGKGKD